MGLTARVFQGDQVCDLMSKLTTHTNLVAVVAQAVQDYLDKKEPTTG
jgi:hypothetical protein